MHYTNRIEQRPLFSFSIFKRKSEELPADLYKTCFLSFPENMTLVIMLVKKFLCCRIIMTFESPHFPEG